MIRTRPHPVGYVDRARIYAGRRIGVPRPCALIMRANLDRRRERSPVIGGPREEDLYPPVGRIPLYERCNDIDIATGGVRANLLEIRPQPRPECNGRRPPG